MRLFIVEILEKQNGTLLKPHLTEIQEYLKQSKDENIQRLTFKIQQS